MARLALVIIQRLRHALILVLLWIACVPSALASSQSLWVGAVNYTLEASATDRALRDARWQSLDKASPSLGRHGTTVWVRVAIPETSDDRRYLVIDYPHLRAVRAVFESGTGAVSEVAGGYLHPSTDGPACRVTCLPLPGKGAMTAYLGISSDSPLILPLMLQSEHALNQSIRWNHLIMGVFYGTFLVMCGFHVFLFLSTRSRDYLMYVVYIASLGIWSASHDGTLRSLLFSPDSHWAGYHFHYLLTLWSLVSGALFCRQFLNTRSHVPLAHHTLNALIIIGLLAMASLLVSGRIQFPAIVGMLTFGLSITAILAGIHELRRGKQVARYYLGAWVFVMAGSLAWVATLEGWWPYAPVSPYLVQIGGFFETLLLSFALGDRINQLQAERTRLQRLSKTQLQEANRKLAASNRFKDTFLSTVSHELRTPMNGVLGSAELLNITALDAEQRAYLDTLFRSGEHMMKLVDDILTYTQLSAGRYAIQRQGFSITDLMQSLEAYAKPMAEAKGLAFGDRVEPGVPLHFEGDVAKLRLVLQHLLDNAFKFTSRGRVNLQVKRTDGDDVRASDDRIWLEFRVTDTGCGMTPDTQSHIFELFSQADGSMTRAYGGLGIGLSLVQQVVTLMGGQVVVNSELHLGTDVVVTVPVFRGAAPAPALPLIDPPENATPLRVLIVEDNPVNQRLLRQIVEKLGQSARIVANGQDAVHAVQTDPPDVVLMDCQMPVMDGFEATRAIREAGHSAEDLPIVAVTANTNVSDRERCLEAGMNDFLPKPVNREGVYRAIRLGHHARQLRHGTSTETR